jgi:predicted TIM-barrel fold metal-dependent hydrolase
MDREERVRFSTQLESRLPDLEGEGIVGEVIFPDGTAENAVPFTGLLGGSAEYEFGLVAAGMRAYNRWLGENCTPNRQIGLAMIPLADLEYALGEVRKVRELGLLGIYPVFDGARPDQQLFDPRFDPLWDVCAQDRLTVNLHATSGRPVGLYDSPAGRNVYQQESNFWSRRVLSQMILGGVLERFPRLKVGFTELQSDWVPNILAQLDDRWEHGGPPGTGMAGHPVISRDLCSKRPSEYFQSQCFVGASALSRHEVDARHEIGVGTMMFGTDHAHSVATWKCTPQYVQLTFGSAEIPESEARLLLGENIVSLYDIDMSELRPIVDRVGRESSELLRQPGQETLDKMPDYLRPRLIEMADRPPAFGLSI